MSTDEWQVQHGDRIDFTLPMSENLRGHLSLLIEKGDGEDTVKVTLVDAGLKEWTMTVPPPVPELKTVHLVVGDPDAL